MTTLVRFLDNNTKGRWANIKMDNGDPCWIGIAQTGILVKKSKIGMFGAKLYEEKDIYKCAEKAMALNEHYPNDQTPEDMCDPILKGVTNAVLHCKDLAEVTLVLNQTEDKGEDVNTKVDISPEKTFSENLVTLSNTFQNEVGFPESGGIKEASSMVTVHIITSIHGELSIIPVEDNINYADAVLSATFLCLVSHQIASLCDEDIYSSLFEVIGNSGKAVFQLYDSDKLKDIILNGHEQYNRILTSIEEENNVKDYMENLRKLIFIYVSIPEEKEKIMSALVSMYSSLKEAQEN